MKVEIITIGDELLIGQTVDTNSAWMARELNKAGLSVYQRTAVPDDRERIITALSDAAIRVNIVLITGGLGPTKDDLTKPTLCEYFNTELVLNQEVLGRIEAYFAQAGRPMLESNRLQAMLPASCRVLPNPRGTAQGMWFEMEGVVYVSMPGVPYEMKGLMLEEVLPGLKQRFQLPAIYHRTILTQGIGESFLAEVIKDWENGLMPLGIKLAYLPSPGLVKLRMSSYGEELEPLKVAVDAKATELLQLIGKFVFGEDEDTLEAVVGSLLAESSETLAVAESCTGGNISQMITSVPGCSQYYLGSITAYSNDAKVSLLGVPKEIITRFGAVSAEVAEAMAAATKKKFNSTYAISTTGVAGPSGGSADKPVGLVWIGVAGPNGIVSHRFQFGNERERNIRRASLMALDLLRKELLS